MAAVAVAVAADRASGPATGGAQSPPPSSAHMPVVAVVAPYGDPFALTDTALKLSQVIEREAKRRSALRSGTLFRVQQNFPLLRRVSSKAASERSSPRLRDSVGRVVAPTPEEGPEDGNRAPTPTKAPMPMAAGAGNAAAVAPTNRGPLALLASKLSIASPRTSAVVPTSATTADLGGGDCSSSDEDNGPPASFQLRVWQFLDDPQSSPAAYYVSVSLFFFIALSTIVFIAQTERALDPYKNVLDTIEALCAVIFSVEFSIRFLASPSKFDFLRTFGNWIDLTAILPFYLEAVLAIENAGSFGAIRIVRLTRVARVLKMSRYSSAIQIFVQAIAISMKALSMLVFLMAIAMVVFSSAIYFAEYTADGCRKGGWLGECTFVNGGTGGAVDLTNATLAASIAGAAAARAANTEACICVDPNPYKSIASSFWWCLVTMSTVGYGDMTPVTLPGKIVGCCTILTGMLVLALPITVIGTNFQKVMKSVVHQTMKTNVDYLRGRRQICREEIQAILQRFHAVTEDIHLDIDDIINVYDTDNSGTLEDEELARFRHDLEVLQNRAFMSQHLAPGVHLGSPPPSSSSSSTTHKGTGATESSRDGSRQTFAAAVTRSPEATAMVRPSKSQTNVLPDGDASTSRVVSRPALSVTPSTPHARPMRRSVGDVPEAFVVPMARPVGDQRREPPAATVPDPDEGQDTPSDDEPEPRNHRHHHSHGHGHRSHRHMNRSGHHEDEVLAVRLLEMQHAFEARLQETEARLESKLLSLNKALLRIENLIQLDD